MYKKRHLIIFGVILSLVLILASFSMTAVTFTGTNINAEVQDTVVNHAEQFVVTVTDNPMPTSHCDMSPPGCATEVTSCNSVSSGNPRRSLYIVVGVKVPLIIIVENELLIVSLATKEGSRHL